MFSFSFLFWVQRIMLHLCSAHMLIADVMCKTLPFKFCFFFFFYISSRFSFNDTIQFARTCCALTRFLLLLLLFVQSIWYNRWQKNGKNGWTDQWILVVRTLVAIEFWSSKRNLAAKIKGSCTCSSLFFMLNFFQQSKTNFGRESNFSFLKRILVTGK